MDILLSFRGTTHTRPLSMRTSWPWLLLGSVSPRVGLMPPWPLETKGPMRPYVMKPSPGEAGDGMEGAVRGDDVLNACSI